MANHGQSWPIMAVFTRYLTTSELEIGKTLTIADAIVLHGQFPSNLFAVILGESPEFLSLLRLLQLALDDLPVELALALLHRPELSRTHRRGSSRSGSDK